MFRPDAMKASRAANCQAARSGSFGVGLVACGGRPSVVDRAPAPGACLRCLGCLADEQEEVR